MTTARASIEEVVYRLIRRLSFIALLVLAVVSVLLFVKDWTNQRAQHGYRLTSDIRQIRQSLEGELYLGKGETIEFVRRLTMERFALTNLVIEADAPCPPASSESSACAQTEFPEGRANYRMIAVRDFRYVPSLSFVYFLLGSLLALGSLVFFFFSQILKTLRRAIVNPLVELTKSPDGGSLSDEAVREIDDLSWRVKDFLRERRDHIEKAALFEMATKVAHDIRSPLAALKVVQGSAKMDEQYKELIHSSISRVQQISNELLASSRSLGPRKYTHSEIQRAIEEVVKEKEVVFGEKKISIVKNFSLAEGHLKVHLLDMIRVVSNLLQNAAEAIGENGTIVLRVENRKQSLSIIVDDDGQGFPTEVLSEVGKSKVSVNKPEGNGIGLFHAYRFAQSHSGNLRLSKGSLGGGRVEIDLPVDTAF